MTLKGKVAIISGANQGLGFEIAKQFVLAGANIMICARNHEKLQQSQQALMPFTKAEQQILIKVCDVSIKEEVDNLITSAIKEFGTIDILVANAGIHGAKGCAEEVDWDEWCRAIDVNLKGTVLQCRAVLPLFKNRKHGKILLLSGGGATKPMPYFSAYAASKAAVVRFGETLSQEVLPFNIDVNMIAPGALNTALLLDVLEAGPNAVGETAYQQALKQQQTGGNSLENAAKLCVFLSSNDSNGITGKLISAVWDPWHSLAQKMNELKHSDIYTLRRIVPEDRHLNWEECK